MSKSFIKLSIEFNPDVEFLYIRADNVVGIYESGYSTRTVFLKGGGKIYNVLNSVEDISNKLDEVTSRGLR